MAQDNSNSSAPPLCAAGCGFFSNPGISNYCSKCLRDIEAKNKKDNNLTTAAAAAAATTSPTATSAPIAIPQRAATAAAAAAAAAAAMACSLPLGASLPSTPPASLPTLGAVGEEGSSKKKKRCGVCQAKLGLLGFECRCEGVFCSKHRFADQHNCTFDFKAHDRQLLEKNNPQVGPNKVQAL